MPEFGGLRKQEKTQLALVGLGSAALAAAVAGKGRRKVALKSNHVVPISTPMQSDSVAVPADFK